MTPDRHNRLSIKPYSPLLEIIQLCSIISVFVSSLEHTIFRIHRMLYHHWIDYSSSSLFVHGNIKRELSCWAVICSILILFIGPRLLFVINYVARNWILSINRNNSEVWISKLLTHKTFISCKNWFSRLFRLRHLQREFKRKQLAVK